MCDSDSSNCSYVLIPLAACRPYGPPARRSDGKAHHFTPLAAAGFLSCVNRIRQVLYIFRKLAFGSPGCSLLHPEIQPAAQNRRQKFCNRNCQPHTGQTSGLCHKKCHGDEQHKASQKRNHLGRRRLFHSGKIGGKHNV